MRNILQVQFETILTERFFEQMAASKDFSERIRKLQEEINALEFDLLGKILW